MLRWITALLFTCLVASLAAKSTLVKTFTDSRGDLINEYVIPDIPVDQRDPGPFVTPTRNAVMITGVPAFDWSYGCGATSAAMLAGYWDRRGYDNIYTGPTNNGVVPMDNSIWGEGECPLSATKQGLDNLATPGHVNRFWVAYQNSGNDPYGTGNPTGTYSSCTADYMGTNQDWWNNGDGSSRFYTYDNGNALSNFIEPETYPIRYRDMIRGLRLFFESRGYAVSANYNQKIMGWEGNTLGFTFDNYKAQIDAGIPVFVHVQGHIMLGVGYDSATSTVYLHNTWDYGLHSMTWGGVYSGMTHFAMSVLTLSPISINCTPLAVNKTLRMGYTGSENLTLTNPGSQPLSYTCAVQGVATVALDETFATTTIPAGWTQQLIYGSNPWVFGTGGNGGSNPSSAYDGSYNARMYWGGASYTMSKLILPVQNLSSVSSATLSFYHTQGVVNTNQDILRVYYKSALGNAWTLLTDFNSEHIYWDYEVLTLPNLSATYYLAFEGIATGGTGICLDKVKVSKYAAPASWLNLNGSNTLTGSIAVGGAGNTIPINFNTTGLSAGSYSSNISISSGNGSSPIIVPVSYSVTSLNSIVFTAPAQGAIWAGGTNQTISWTYYGTASSLRLYYATNGITFSQVATVPTVFGSNSYTWAVPFEHTTTAKVKLSEVYPDTYSLVSPVFSIAIPVIAVNQSSLNMGIASIEGNSIRNFTISNTGLQTLSGTITSPPFFLVTFSSQSFSRNDAKPSQELLSSSEENYRNLNYSIPAGGSITYDVTFMPAELITYNGTITITHNAGGANKTISVTGQGGKATIINSPASIAVSTVPFGSINQIITISNTGNMPLNYTMTAPFLFGVTFKLNGANTVSNTIAPGGSNEVTFSIAVGYRPYTTYTLQIPCTSNDIYRSSFNIPCSLSVVPPFTLTAPVAGDVWLPGTLHNITWNYRGIGTSGILRYSIDGGNLWALIGSVNLLAGTNSYAWTIPSENSANCKIMIEDNATPTFFSVYSDIFSIGVVTPPSIPSGISISRHPATGNIIISWNASTGNPTGYKIYGCPNVDFEPGDTTLVSTVSAANTTLNIPAASLTARLFYRVTAYRD